MCYRRTLFTCGFFINMLLSLYSCVILWIQSCLGSRCRSAGDPPQTDLKSAPCDSITVVKCVDLIIIVMVQNKSFLRDGKLLQ